MSDLLGDGIFAVDGDKWRHQRKLASFEFTTRNLRDYSSVVFRRKAIALALVISEAADSNRAVDIQVRAYLHIFCSNIGRGRWLIRGWC